MNEISQRLKKNGLLAVLAMLLAAVAGYELREIDGNSYRAVRAAFPTGSADYRAAVATAMAGGTINRWELQGLERQLARDGQAFIIDARAANLHEERLLLAAKARWGASR
ncbi:hypothetical protein E7V67_001430 [[Empedobacter] haloabium]|uniref:Uncharacterized protein n=1 Tax=[Empedobacter] haloabium TaxID=592317 RepID=A0ABZ1UM89_9BURK